jgi:hypothetical protein
MHILCDICGKRILLAPEPYELRGAAGLFQLCSIDCVIEQAWAVREAQPKLSKSRMEGVRMDEEVPR